MAVTQGARILRSDMDALASLANSKTTLTGKPFVFLGKVKPFSSTDGDGSSALPLVTDCEIGDFAVNTAKLHPNSKVWKLTVEPSTDVASWTLQTDWVTVASVGGLPASPAASTKGYVLPALPTLAPAVKIYRSGWQDYTNWLDELRRLYVAVGAHSATRNGIVSPYGPGVGANNFARATLISGPWMHDNGQSNFKWVGGLRFKEPYVIFESPVGSPVSAVRQCEPDVGFLTVSTLRKAGWNSAMTTDGVLSGELFATFNRVGFPTPPPPTYTLSGNTGNIVNTFLTTGPGVWYLHLTLGGTVNSGDFFIGVDGPELTNLQVFTGIKITHSYLGDGSAPSAAAIDDIEVKIMLIEEEGTYPLAGYSQAVTINSGEQTGIISIVTNGRLWAKSYPPSRSYFTARNGSVAAPVPANSPGPNVTKATVKPVYPYPVKKFDDLPYQPGTPPLFTDGVDLFVARGAIIEINVRRNPENGEKPASMPALDVEIGCNKGPHNASPVFTPFFTIHLDADQASKTDRTPIFLLQPTRTFDNLLRYRCSAEVLVQGLTVETQFGSPLDVGSVLVPPVLARDYNDIETLLGLLT